MGSKMGVSVSGFIKTPPATGTMLMTFIWPLLHLRNIDNYITSRGDWRATQLLAYKGSMYVYLLSFGLFCICTSSYFPMGHNVFLGLTFIAGGLHYILVMCHCHTLDMRGTMVFCGFAVLSFLIV